MLLLKQLNSCFINTRTKQKGFAVLTSAVLLSFASIIFTVNMVSLQLVDNKIVANYYRNNEAFANAESGVNFILSQLGEPEAQQALLQNLPMIYENSTEHYKVVVKSIMPKKLSITSTASSEDGSASREINLEVDIYINFPIPASVLSVNGQINLSESAQINLGCEGVSDDKCSASGNIAEYALIRHSEINNSEDDSCTISEDENSLVSNVIKEGISEKVISKAIDDDGVEYSDWGGISIPEGSEFKGLISDNTLIPHSLFELTFGIELNQFNLDLLWSEAAQVDMRYGGNCSSMLHNVDILKEIIYIKGDCNISQYDTQPSSSTESELFIIGSSEYPKLIFIEGGSFITPLNTQASIIGMLYFLPSTHSLVDEGGNLVDLNGDILSEGMEAIEVADTNIDISGVKVNGALLSEYPCTHNNSDEGNKPNLSTRFDKLILDQLYSDLGFKAMDSGYRLSAGSWRDF